MLCSKCHQKEATIHFATVLLRETTLRRSGLNGTEEETVHLCKDCGPPIGFDLDKLEMKEIEALSVVGKKCEFCGSDAFSGEMRASGGAIYWCFDCGLEIGGILGELLISERPDLLQRSKEDSSFLSFCSDPGLQAWSEAASDKAVQTLKERRHQDGRDKGS